jgi:hypothetical protein
MKTENLTSIFFLIVSILCLFMPFIKHLSLDLTIICVLSGVNLLNIEFVKNVSYRRAIAIGSLVLLIYPYFHFIKPFFC